MRLLCFLLWLSAGPVGGWGQTSPADNPPFPPDTAALHDLIALIEATYLSDPEKALRYGELARQAAVALADPAGEIESLGWLAYLLEQQGKIDPALEYNLRALALARKTGEEKGASQLLNNIAAIYKNQGRIAEALDCYEQSIALARKVNHQAGLATTLNNVGLIYFNQGQVQKALDFYHQSLHTEEAAGHQAGVAVSLYNIASVFLDLGLLEEALTYAQRSLAIEQEIQDKYSLGYSLNFLGTIYEKQGRWAEALDHYQQSLRVREAIADEQGIAYSWRNLGGLYEKLDSLPTVVLPFYTRSLATFERLGDKWGIASLSNALAKWHLKTGEPARAKPYALRALALARELGFPGETLKSAEVLAQVYRRDKQWEAATGMDDLFLQLKDSIQNEQTRKAGFKAMLQYDYEKKEMALRNEQEKQNLLAAEAVAKEKLIRNFSLAGLIACLLVAGLVLRQRNRLSNEKRRSDALLLNILPAETAEELKSTGVARARSYDFVTVLFTDFKDFTRSSESLSAEALVEEIHFYYVNFDRIITEFGLEKIKTIGDSYMCAGGLPVANTSNPCDAVRAALKIRDFMERHQAERSQHHKLFFEIRIGLHTGPVVAGVVGEKKFAYDIWGDTVNTAMRLEQNSTPGRINISGATYAAVREQFRCHYRGKIAAKNKGELVMYFVEAAR